MIVMVSLLPEKIFLLKIVEMYLGNQFYVYIDELIQPKQLLMYK